MSIFAKVVLVYYIVINIVLFIYMCFDKHRAKTDKRRVPESTLFIMALLGGAVGGFFGMFTFHHKTKKPHFYIIYALATLLHASLLYFLISKGIL